MDLEFITVETRSYIWRAFSGIVQRCTRVMTDRTEKTRVLSESTSLSQLAPLYMQITLIRSDRDGERKAKMALLTVYQCVGLY